MDIPVIFKKVEGTVVACFPTLLGTNDPYTMTSYVHVGQHGSCSTGFVSFSKRAKPEEYADLLSEIKSIYEAEGEDTIVVVRKQTDKHLQARIDALAEIYK